MNVKPFIPHDLNKIKVDWQQLFPIIIEANKSLARYDAFLQNLINPELLIAPLLTREAVYSSRIEGTQVSFEDIMLHEGGAYVREQQLKYNADIIETVNYKRALLYGAEMLAIRELTLTLIKELQRMLLSDVRGSKVLLGEFRKRQVWIGKAGTPIEKARFIPPDPVIVPEHLEKFEKFIKAEYKDTLVQLAIMHAQFEIIHPFEDGNGRVGRLLIPLFLKWKKILHSPSFYLSEYLEENRSEYYDKLLAVSAKNDWNGWIKYMLEAIIAQARTNTFKAKQIIELYNKSKVEFLEITRSQYAVPILDAFFKKPVMKGPELFESIKITSKGNFSSIINNLVDNNIITIVEQGKGRFPTIYRYDKLYNLVSSL